MQDKKHRSEQKKKERSEREHRRSNSRANSMAAGSESANQLHSRNADEAVVLRKVSKACESKPSVKSLNGTMD